MTQPYQLHQGDCLETLRNLADNSIDAIVTDPPAGIAFMNKAWDKDKGGKKQWIAWMQEVAAECLRVLKPGGHALVWALPRTSHWTADAWEEAGWEPRDKVYHAFGSGFPKSLDIGKALDKAAGAEREVVGVSNHIHSRGANTAFPKRPGEKEQLSEQTAERGNTITAPATPEAQQWDGWGTALKPAVEEWWLFRKPFKGTVAGNVLAWGVGGLNVDGCRVEHSDSIPVFKKRNESSLNAYGNGLNNGNRTGEHHTSGRFPAHLTHDGSEEVLAAFPVTSSGVILPHHNDMRGEGHQSTTYGVFKVNPNKARGIGDSGSAARFFQSCPLGREDIEARRLFYQAKASKRDRDEGLEGFEEKRRGVGDTRPSGDFNERLGPRADGSERSAPTGRNTHPTVKATPLMRWLCRLITPPGGVVLDPFCGSGSTGKACMFEGFRFIGIDLYQEHIDIAEARIKWALEQAQEIQEKQLNLFP
jgi:DNA modification methylase